MSELKHTPDEIRAMISEIETTHQDVINMSAAEIARIWRAAVHETDALLVFGGDVWYLCRWMRESGLADLLPSLREMIYVGVSAGSMVTAPIFGETYDDPDAPFVIDKGLGIVDFSLLPHLNHENHPESSTDKVERMAAEVPVSTYGIDDQTAIKVVNGVAEVVSEGHWKRFSS